MPLPFLSKYYPHTVCGMKSIVDCMESGSGFNTICSANSLPIFIMNALKTGENCLFTALQIKSKHSTQILSQEMKQWHFRFLLGFLLPQFKLLFCFKDVVLQSSEAPNSLHGFDLHLLYIILHVLFLWKILINQMFLANNVKIC